MSRQYLYDKNNKKFVLSIPNDELIELPKTEVAKIGYKNVEKIIKFVEKKNLNTHFLHFSFGKIEKINDIVGQKSWDEGEKTVYYNPVGLWLSYGDSWLEYVNKYIKNPSMWNLFNYIYDVEVNDTVLIIKSRQELYNFIDKFKNSNDIIKIYDVINWKKVMDTYNGLIILGDDIWNLELLDRMTISGNESVQNFINDLMGDSWKSNMLLLSEWVRHWGCKTGVVWSKKGIAKINKIKKISFNVEFIKK